MSINLLMYFVYCEMLTVNLEVSFGTESDFAGKGDAWQMWKDDEKRGR